MNTTALIGLVLGLVVAPTALARAWVTPDPAKAAMFGAMSAGALLVGCALVALVIRMELR